MVFLLDLSWITENFCICSGNSSKTHLYSESTQQQLSRCMCPLSQKGFLCLLKPHLHSCIQDAIVEVFLLLWDQICHLLLSLLSKTGFGRSLQSPDPPTSCSRTYTSSNPFWNPFWKWINLPFETSCFFSYNPHSSSVSPVAWTLYNCCVSSQSFLLH